MLSNRRLIKIEKLTDEKVNWNKPSLSISDINVETLVKELSVNFNRYMLMMIMRNLFRSISWSNQRQDIIPYRVHDLLTEPSKIGGKTQGGTAYTSNFKEAEDLINYQFMILKVCYDATDAVHESIIGYYLNRMRKSIPNFAFVYGLLKCSDVFYYQDGIVSSWCESGLKQVTYIGYENIDNLGSLATHFNINNSSLHTYNIRWSFFNDPLEEQYNNVIGRSPEVEKAVKSKVEMLSAMECLLYLQQVVLAMKEANSAFKYNHNDLHVGNILIRKYANSPINIKYGSKYLLSPGSIATIIDYGRSRITVNDTDYFPPSLEGDFSIKYKYEANRSNVARDMYRLILFSSKINDNKTYFTNTLQVFGISDIVSAIQEGKNTDYYYSSSLNEIDFIDKLSKAIEDDYNKYKPFGEMFLTTPNRPVLECIDEEDEASLDTYLKKLSDRVVPSFADVLWYDSSIARNKFLDNPDATFQLEENNAIKLTSKSLTDKDSLYILEQGVEATRYLEQYELIGKLLGKTNPRLEQLKAKVKDYLDKILKLRNSLPLKGTTPDYTEQIEFTNRLLDKKLITLNTLNNLPSSTITTSTSNLKK